MAPPGRSAQASVSSARREQSRPVPVRAVAAAQVAVAVRPWAASVTEPHVWAEAVPAAALVAALAEAVRVGEAPAEVVPEAAVLAGEAQALAEA